MSVCLSARVCVRVCMHVHYVYTVLRVCDLMYLHGLPPAMDSSVGNQSDSWNSL